jgi:hypothetical protein
LEEKDGTTDVTWVIHGKNEQFAAKLFATLMNMDKMLGKQFERGLELLEAAAAR